MLVLLAASCAFGLLANSSLPAESPLKPPAGWKSEKADGATVLTPGNVAAGKFYVVMVTMLNGKAGALDDVFADGRKMVESIGSFTQAGETKQARSDGGWDYKFALGTLQKGDRGLIGQVMSIKKGDDGGVVIVLADSVDTMSSYAEPFMNMVRAMGGSKAPPAASGVVDLNFTVPEGWVQQKVNNFPLLVKQKNEDWVKFRMSLLIFPSEPTSGTIREQFEGFWNAFVKPNYSTNLAPVPMMVRLKSGYACAFDADSEAKDKNGNQATVAIYMIAHGGRVVPVMGIYSGTDWLFDKTAEAEIARFLDTATIPGATGEKVTMFTASAIAGNWSESGAAYADYVRGDGSYAGDATIATAAYFNLAPSGSYERTLMAVSSRGNLREKDAGTWSVDDDELVLSKGGRYSLLGYGANPKLGRFLIISNYSNQKTRLKFTNPRGILQAMWLRAK